MPPVKKVLEKQEEKSRNQEKIKNYYQWEAAKNYFPVKTIVAHEELYKEFFSYNAIHQEEKFCIVVMQEEELVTDVELVNRIIQEKYRGFIKDFFFSKINEEYVMLLSGIECMDNELIVQEKVESMLSYFCTCKHMNITMGVGLVYSSKEKIYQSYNEALYALNVGNGDSIDAIDNTNYYTKVEDAVRFVEQTGCDSLAIAVGNAHGPYVKTPNLDLERIYAIRKKVNIPLVLHGCSDIPEEQMKEAVNLGMSKFNIATEYFRTMYQSIEKRINNQEFEGNGVKLMYDIKEEMIDFVIQKIRLLNPNKYSM